MPTLTTALILMMIPTLTTALIPMTAPTSMMILTPITAFTPIVTDSLNILTQTHGLMNFQLLPPITSS